jgi:ankyrin repeat protein
MAEGPSGANRLAVVLSDAVWDEDLPGVLAALNAGADPNESSEQDRMAPLHLAIEQLNGEIVRLLIDAGADLNRDPGNGWTPLAHAIDSECDAASQSYDDADPNHASMELTELLLKAGARPTDKAFEVAQDYRRMRALDLLRRYSPPNAA